MSTDSVKNDGQTLSLKESELKEARAWLRDCHPEQSDEINESSDQIVEKNISRLYDGGLQSFKRHCC